MAYIEEALTLFCMEKTSRTSHKINTWPTTNTGIARALITQSHDNAGQCRSRTKFALETIHFQSFRSDIKVSQRRMVKRYLLHKISSFSVLATNCSFASLCRASMSSARRVAKCSTPSPKVACWNSKAWKLHQTCWETFLQCLRLNEPSPENFEILSTLHITLQTPKLKRHIYRLCRRSEI